MKREIIFRGKLCHSNSWVYGNLCKTTNGDSFILPIDVCEEDGHHFRVDSDLPFAIDSDSIGQFTGLLDKNGQKIFEGDILSFSESYAPHFAKVIFATDEIGSCGCCYSAFQGSGFVGEILPGSDYSYSCFSEDLRESEIIGNVFDNPELVVKND